MRIKPISNKFDVHAVPPQTSHAAQAVGPVAAVQNSPSSLREDQQLYTPTGRLASPPATFHAFA
ncbi:MAG: hypothetical protein KBC88_04705 [Alphaproteobacteria bacterium]|jgi:hypothetical protein|nr:hypothetical protein [Alphaproteobacteria bacterium]